MTFTPTTGYTGPASFTYAISDGRGGTASASVSLTVNPADRQAAVAVADSGFTTTQNTALNIPASTLLANDSDPDGDPLTITGVSGGSANTGTPSFNAQNNTVTFTPTTGYTGPASFTYAISDGRGGTASASVSLTVNSATSTTASLFTASNIPAQTNLNDGTAIESVSSSPPPPRDRSPRSSSTAAPATPVPIA